MAGLVYQPVALPGLGGASQSSEAASGISTGLTNLGATLTGLATRRQKRIDDEADRKNKMGLDILNTAIDSAKSEEELDAIVKSLGDVVLPGQATAIQTGRTNFLNNEGSRQDNRYKGSLADAEGYRATQENLTAQDMSEDFRIKALQADADKVYAPRIAEASNKAYTDPKAYAADMAAITRDMAVSHPGANITGLYTAIDGTANEGIATRTAADVERTDAATNATTRGLQPSALSAGISQNRNLTVTNDSATAGIIRTDALGEQQRAADSRYEAWRSTALTNPNLKDLIYNSDLPPEEKNRLLLRADTEDVTKTSVTGEFAGLDQEDTSTLSNADIAMRKFSNQVFGTSLPIPSETSKANPKTIVDNMSKQYEVIRNADPAFEIDKRAKMFETSEEYAPILNKWGNVGITLRDSVGKTYEIASGETIILDNIRKAHGLSRAQLLAVAETAIKEDDGPRGWFNKPEMRNQILNEKAAAYAADLKVMGGKYSEIEQVLAEAETYGLLAQEAKSNAARARAKGQTDAANKYEEQASTYTLQLRAREDLFKSAVSKNSNQQRKPEEIAQELSSGGRSFGGMVKRQ